MGIGWNTFMRKWRVAVFCIVVSGALALGGGRRVREEKVADRPAPRGKQVALAFEDGPDPRYTPRLLRILRQYRVQATFFVVGARAQTNPELVRTAYVMGHQIGNHGFRHLDLGKLSPRQAQEEWERCSAVIENITGERPRVARAPMVLALGRAGELAEQLGLTITRGGRAPQDIGRPGVSAIIRQTTAGVRDGEVIVLHDGVEQTLQALPEILRRLEAQGFECVRLDDLPERRQG